MIVVQRVIERDDVVLSTNIPLRNDGLPYANFSKISDHGAAIYFQYKGKPMCFACDRWQKVEDNIQAIRHTINALRGIARWGSGDMLEAAFTGFQALPPAAGREWWQILECVSSAPLSEFEAHYKMLARRHHPDNGGDAGKMAELNGAIAQARKARGAA